MRVGGMNKRYCIPKCAAHTHTHTHTHTHFLENETNICTHKYSAYLPSEKSHTLHFTLSCPTHITHIFQKEHGCFLEENETIS